MRLRLFLSLFALSPLSPAASDVATYSKRQLSDIFYSEGAAFGDLNRDGHIDVVSGPYWYEGPDFKQRHEFYPALPYDPLHYSNNFLAFVHDFNADGWNDVLVLGFPGTDASWFENPGKPDRMWRRHVVFLPVDNESPTFGDLLGTGRPVLLCTSRGRIGYASYDPKDPVRPWVFSAITPPGPWQRFTHGLGFGDINGDGRNDIVEKNGWWEQPASLDGNPTWKRHAFDFAAGARGGAQMHVYDVNGDGLNDVVSAGDAHGYGLSWFEQIRDAAGGISFREHPITSPNPDQQIAGVQFSQPHALALADFDGDGLLDLLTGKRWWAHGPRGDADPGGDAVLHVFLLRREAEGAHYVPHLIDNASGVGTQIVALDIDGDGRPDIVSGNKRGTFVFRSRPSAAE